MGAGRRQQHALLTGEGDHLAAKRLDVLASFFDVLTNASADLDDRLVHLRLDRLVQRQLGFGEDLRCDVRAEVPCLRINRLIFLFNPDAEAWPLHLLTPCSFAWPSVWMPTTVSRPSPSSWNPLPPCSRGGTHSNDNPA